jgi:release factor glutamine methyltransferase
MITLIEEKPVNMRSLARAQSLLRKHVEDSARPAEFTLLGRDWELMEGVFAPTYTPVTRLFTTWIPYPPGGTFLEMGCGAGVTAVVAAQSGCMRVTALDISATAVENTRRNAERHEIAGRVRVLQSDMFDALGTEERFDMIFWNSNFVETPEGFVNETELHHALFDPQYQAHRKFLKQAPRYLAGHGRLLLGFSDLGNYSLLRDMCDEARLSITVLHAEKRDLGQTVEFQLLELRRS